MNRIVSCLAVLALVSACGSPVEPASSVVSFRGDAAAKGAPVHRVTGGGSDFFAPGFDANWSLVAMQFADGSVQGHLTDAFGHGNGGVHVVIDCLEVEGNQAWVSGTAKGGIYDGRTWLAQVQDNGRSAKDPADLISFSLLAFEGSTVDCHTRLPIDQFERQKGQVTID